MTHRLVLSFGLLYLSIGYCLVPPFQQPDNIHSPQRTPTHTYTTRSSPHTVHSTTVTAHSSSLTVTPAPPPATSSVTSCAMIQDTPQDIVVNCSGNIVFEFSNQTIGLGNLDVNDILAKGEAQCLSFSCDQTPVDVYGPTYGWKNQQDNILISVYGDFDSTTYGPLQGALSKAIALVAKTRTVNWVQQCPPGIWGEELCPFENQQAGSFTETIVPSYFAISYQPPGTQGQTHPKLSVTLAQGSEADDSFCTLFTGISAGLAGIVAGTGIVEGAGVLGALFSLAGLACSHHG